MRVLLNRCVNDTSEEEGGRLSGWGDDTEWQTMLELSSLAAASTKKLRLAGSLFVVASPASSGRRHPAQACLARLRPSPRCFCDPPTRPTCFPNPRTPPLQPSGTMTPTVPRVPMMLCCPPSDRTSTVCSPAPVQPPRSPGKCLDPDEWKERGRDGGLKD